MKTYYCDDGFQKYLNEKWEFILRMACKTANFVEMNVLFPDLNQQNIEDKLGPLWNDLIEIGRHKEKIYCPDRYIRLRLSSMVKDFLYSKQYIDWNNYWLEDPSFYNNNTEFLATITHEYYTIILLDESERNRLTNVGFSFWCYGSPEQSRSKHEILFYKEVMDGRTLRLTGG